MFKVRKAKYSSDKGIGREGKTKRGKILGLKIANNQKCVFQLLCIPEESNRELKSAYKGDLRHKRSSRINPLRGGLSLAVTKSAWALVKRGKEGGRNEEEVWEKRNLKGIREVLFEERMRLLFKR